MNVKWWVVMHNRKESEMNTIETNLIQERIKKIMLGEPTIHGQMAMFPLLDEEESAADYLTLDDSISNGCARVTEIDEGGSVPELTFKNSGEKRVFLMEGEELVGAKQSRTLNLSILAPADKEIIIPVTCVESGRWSYNSPRFSTSDRAHFSRGRREKMASVSDSMRMDASPAADQREVWDQISEKGRRMKSHSPTSAMGDIFEDHREHVGDYVKAFTAVENQAGMLVMVADDIVGLDLFDSTETLKKLMPKLIRSFALDAIEECSHYQKATGTEGMTSFNREEEIRRRTKPYQPKIADAEDLLKKSAAAKSSTHPGVGDGDNLRLQGEEVIGGALTLDNRVIHLSVFRNDDLPGSKNHRRARGARVRSASHRRSHGRTRDLSPEGFLEFLRRNSRGDEE